MAKMRAGTCKITKTGRKLCKSKSGKVRFKKGGVGELGRSRRKPVSLFEDIGFEDIGRGRGRACKIIHGPSGARRGCYNSRGQFRITGMADIADYRPTYNIRDIGELGRTRKRRKTTKRRRVSY